MALLAQSRLNHEPVAWQWEGAPYRSRLLVSFGNGAFLRCNSYDEDIHARLKDPDK